MDVENIMSMDTRDFWMSKDSDTQVVVSPHIIKELITALAAAQAELAECKVISLQQIDDHKSLVELQKSMYANVTNDLRAQLAASQAEVEQLRKDADWIATTTEPYG